MENWQEISHLSAEKQIAFGRNELFKCTSLITSPGIKRFTRNFLARVPEQFWEVPSSSSGKYHPPEDQGPGGLVRHVIKGLEVVVSEARLAQLTPREQNQALSAFTLHDTFKNGVPWGENTDYTHGIIAAEQILASPCRINLQDREAIAGAVRYHMSRWSYLVDPWKKESFTRRELQGSLDELARALYSPSRIERVVQIADYWASRPNISFMPGVTVADFRHDNPPLTK